jgi:YbgC/YbaW family acyl-CoA thioester hydrolase
MPEGTAYSFESEIQVTFGDCDPAGIMYFSRIFDFSHQVFEELIKNSEIGWENWFRSGRFVVPLIHVEADYKAPLLPGKTYLVKARVARLGDSSFEMEYAFFDSENLGHRLLAAVKIVHVFADTATRKKISVPSEIRSTLQRFL